MIQKNMIKKGRLDLLKDDGWVVNICQRIQDPDVTRGEGKDESRTEVLE